MTRPIPRLLGYATGRRGGRGRLCRARHRRLPDRPGHRPEGQTARPTTGRYGRSPRGGLRRHRRALPGPDPTCAGRQAPGAGPRQRHGAGSPFHPARRAARPGRPDGRDSPVHPAGAGRLPSRPRAGPHVVEAFVLTEQAGGADTRLAYHGEIGADLWRVGQRWCELVARRWEQTVAASPAAVKAEAERRAASGVGRRRPRPDSPPPTADR
jgi:hypothetical protein